jgi:hypothetical protein
MKPGSHITCAISGYDNKVLGVGTIHSIGINNKVDCTIINENPNIHSDSDVFEVFLPVNTLVVYNYFGKVITFNTINTEIKTGDDFVDFHEYNSNVAINDSYTKAYVPCIVKVGTITYDFKVRTERYVAPTE